MPPPVQHRIGHFCVDEVTVKVELVSVKGVTHSRVTFLLDFLAFWSPFGVEAAWPIMNVRGLAVSISSRAFDRNYSLKDDRNCR